MSPARTQLAQALDVPGVRWSVLAHPLDRPGAPLIEHDPATVLASASTAKILLLIALADRIEAGVLSPDQPVARTDTEPVADSGVWQHLRVDVLPLADAARLVGLASDNWATNALIDVVGGIEAIAAVAERAGVSGIGLHDKVRGERVAAHPETLSTGSARGYVALMAALAQRRVLSPAVSERVWGWLSGGLDLSMVAAAFGLDPLSHHSGPDRGLGVVNKTGTDTGVRADVGVVSGPAGRVVYACLANWRVTDQRDETRDAVLAVMREIGGLLREAVTYGVA
ncbi:hypothetical protein BHQ15_00620 [Mycolicibacillus koreensis]|nr:hypothetical protein BHQ15_00620 [Mycolicibacillus koreensis]